MLRLHDTLTRRDRAVEPREPPRLRMYSCGPTVYRSVHIGNLRTYLMADWIKRIARSQGWQVEHVKNITDVGHMRQEMAERGGDKVIAAALAAGRTPREIAAEFEEEFHLAEALLGIEPADVFPRATDHVPQMISLVERLLDRGLAYAVDGTVYFDTSAQLSYGALSGNSLEQLQRAAGAEPDPAKRHPADFTLWRQAEPGRQLMVWDSPFGRGYPGWHIECSAMSMAYLGEEIDLHTGGVDNIFPHHEDELAQSEGATGKPFVRHWVHGQHLLADGVKMAKSQGNVYTLQDLLERGFDPRAFRYLCSTVRYGTRLNFTLASLAAAQRGLQRLRQVAEPGGGAEDRSQVEQLQTVVQAALEDNLDLPRALALVWDFARARNLSGATRRAGLLGADSWLGLALDRPSLPVPGPGAWRELASARDQERRQRAYGPADAARVSLLGMGVVPEDGPAGTRYRVASALDRRHGLISSPLEIADQRGEPDLLEVSVSIVSNGYPNDLTRCVRSIQNHRGSHSVEILAVDNDAQEVGAVLDDLAGSDPSVRPFHADHQLGEGAARNVTLRAARGSVVLILDTGVELTGDCFTPLLQALHDPQVGAVGRWGAVSRDMREFDDSDGLEVDAIDGYCLAFARERLQEVGLWDERFRFYRMLDFHFSLTLRSFGFRQRRIPNLPVQMHRHRGWEETDPEERERLSRLNFRRFFERWHHRPDLLLAADPAASAHG
ncbi:MAG TPA: cysteine--tRNA ligase [Candidatus Dormibacteraeota bacterium]|nr:cysteine--tRNA ligase [Candidatus Dormibacteraeota bacterium]